MISIHSVYIKFYIVNGPVADEGHHHHPHDPVGAGVAARCRSQVAPIGHGRSSPAGRLFGARRDPDLEPARGLRRADGAEPDRAAAGRAGVAGRDGARRRLRRAAAVSDCRVPPPIGWFTAALLASHLAFLVGSALFVHRIVFSDYEKPTNYDARPMSGAAALGCAVAWLVVLCGGYLYVKLAAPLGPPLGVCAPAMICRRDQVPQASAAEVQQHRRQYGREPLVVGPGA